MESIKQVSRREHEMHKEKKQLVKEELVVGEEMTVNILGPELNELLLGRLNFKVIFKNIKVYVEYDRSQMGPEYGFGQSFTICLTLKDFRFESVRVILIGFRKNWISILMRKGGLKIWLRLKSCWIVFRIGITLKCFTMC